MDATAKLTHSFNDLDKWSSYALRHMPKIEAQTHTSAGLEIWLVAKRGVLGKWSDAIKQGYIEEYRDSERLAAESRRQFN